MIVQAKPHATRASTVERISREIAELEQRIVPGMKQCTVLAIRDQIQRLVLQLPPDDDRRNPKYWRGKAAPAPAPAPAYLWNADDYHTAVWAAKKRADGKCDICQGPWPELPRIKHLAPGETITKANIEVVCQPCADQHPRERYF